MNKLLVTISICWIFFSCAAPKKLSSLDNSKRTESESKSDNKELIQWVENKVDSVIRKNNIPAISVGIIKDGNVIMHQGFGVHNRNSKLQASENSIYQIASDSKKMTGIIVKNLVAEGNLKLDEPIITYLGNSLEGRAKERLQNITLRHLLLHKSGLPYREPTMKRKDGDPMLIPYTEQDLLNDLNNVELKSEPGFEFSYSNFGYAVIGFICEQASGKTYSELIKKYFSKAYKMPNTTTVLTDEQLKNLVTPYRKDDRNKETKAFNMGKLASAGGVYSNINDLSNLMIHQINAYVEHNQNKKLDSPLILTENSSNKEDGYGFGLGKKVFKTGTQYGHGGDLDGFASAYIFSPEYKSGVILLTSSGGSWVGELEKELFYKLTNRNYTPPQKSIALEFYNLVSEKGIEEGKKWFEEHKNSTNYYLKQAEMNNVGYALLQHERLEDAIEVFKLNVELFPKSANVYDSLGETYLKKGDNELAIENYKKSVELDPENENAIVILKKMENK